ncbi:MAG: cell division protein FtsL [Myxococcales bacterium]|nr:cell division protein FtsL [Myxococcales bacterium]
MERRSQRQPAAARDHGLRRASDRRPEGGPIGEEAPLRPIRGRRPQGLALVIIAGLGLVTAIGVMRVQTRARVLELGAAITDLTDEHTRLLDEKRRLEAERAFLRHPDHVQQVALDHLAMEPAQPERIQRITVKPAAGEEGGR